MWCVCVCVCFTGLFLQHVSGYIRSLEDDTEMAVTWEQIDSSQGCFISIVQYHAIPIISSEEKLPWNFSTFWKGQPDDAMVRDVPHVESIPHWIVGEFEQSQSLELEHGKVGASQILKNDVQYVRCFWVTHDLGDDPLTQGSTLRGITLLMLMIEPTTFVGMKGTQVYQQPV